MQKLWPTSFKISLYVTGGQTTITKKHEVNIMTRLETTDVAFSSNSVAHRKQCRGPLLG